MKGGEKTMNWKDFFRPNITKVIFSLFLLLLSFFLSGLNFFTTTGDNSSYIFENPLYWLLLLPFLIILKSNMYLLSPKLFGVISLISLFIYWYLLSCVVVWLFNKIRGKK